MRCLAAQLAMAKCTVWATGCGRYSADFDAVNRALLS
jgi:hypothetical protein